MLNIYKKNSFSILLILVPHWGKNGMLLHFSSFSLNSFEHYWIFSIGLFQIVGSSLLDPQSWLYFLCMVGGLYQYYEVYVILKGRPTSLDCVGFSGFGLVVESICFTIFRCNPLKGCISRNRIFTYLLTYLLTHSGALSSSKGLKTMK